MILQSMNLSDRAPDLYIRGRAGRSPPISPRSLNAIISNSTFGLPEKVPHFAFQSPGPDAA
jgi:hypothetical protein